jgi:hypothetical protein
MEHIIYVWAGVVYFKGILIELLPIHDSSSITSFEKERGCLEFNAD